MRFVLEDKIGEGAMGVVYRALDTDTGETVAVKILPAKTASRDAAISLRQITTCVWTPSVEGIQISGGLRQTLAVRGQLDPRGFPGIPEFIKWFCLRRSDDRSYVFTDTLNLLPVMREIP